MPVIGAMGDSITVGTSLQGTTYVNRIASALSSSVALHAVSGTRAINQSYITRGITPSDMMIYMMGLNDQRFNADNATIRSIYKRLLRSVLITTSGMSYTHGSAVTRTGTWNSSNTTGVYSTGPFTATKTVNGSTVYIGYIQSTDATFNTSIDVYIDNVLIETVSLTGSTDNYLGVSNNYGTAALRYAGLADGPHEVKIVGNAPGKCFGLEYIMGNGNQVFKKPQMLLSISKQVNYVSPDNAANTDAWNSVVSSVYDELKSDGLRIGFLDVNTVLNTQTDYFDNLHWNDSGHTKVANAVLPIIYTLGNQNQIVSGCSDASAHLPLNGTKSYQTQSGSTVIVDFNNGIIDSIGIS